jgi:hypothetical protein
VSHLTKFFCGARSCDAAGTLAPARQGHSQILAWLLTGILAWSGSARAQSALEAARAPLPSWLSVSRGPGAESCPNREQLVSAVRSRLTSAGPPSSDELSARVTLSRGEEGLLALVELRHCGRAIGARQLASQDASCEELTRAVAIVVALAVDVHSSGQRDACAPPEPAREISEPTPDYANDEFLPLPTPSTERSAKTSVRFGGELTLGLMPHPQAGVGVALAQQVGSLLELDVGVSGFPWSSTSSLPNQHAEIDYRAALGQALVCLPVARSFWARSAVCAGLSGGAVSTVSRGLGTAGPTISPLVNGVFAATQRFRLEGPWFVVLSAAMGIPWLRKEFVFSALDGTTPSAYRMPSQFGSFGIAIEYDLNIRPSSSQSSRGRTIHF